MAEEKTLNIAQRLALATRVGFKVARGSAHRGDPVFPRGIFGSLWSGPGFIGSFAQALSFGSFRGTNINYAGEVGELTSSSLCMAVWQYIATSLTEAPPIVTAYKKGDTKGEVVPEHPLVKLIQSPNPFCDVDNMLMAFALDWLFSGDVYWIKIFKGKYLTPSELWYVPYFMMQPLADERDPSIFIKEYQYIVDGNRYSYKPEEVIHFKRGINPRDLRRGVGVFDSVLREIYTDNQAANFSASILKNWGIVPFVLSPPKNSKSDSVFKAFGDNPNDAREQALRIKTAFMEATTGDHRGEPIVNTIPLEITKLGYSPAELDISQLRKIPESRVAAVTGLPASLLQFLVGLEHGTSYASYKEAREQAFESVVAPLLKIIATAINKQLMPDFGDPQGRRLEFSFDLSGVRVLQEDQDKVYTRADIGVKGGWLLVSDARSMVGLNSEEADHIYLRGGQAVKEGEEMLPPAPPPKELPPADDEPDAIDGEVVEEDEDTEKLLNKILVRVLAEKMEINGNGNHTITINPTPLIKPESLIPRQLKGGAGSGNFGHAGRPGLIGGSSDDGGGRPSGIKWKQEVDPKTGRPIPIKCDSVDEAALLVLDGKVVELPTVEKASTLIERLAAIANEAKALGAKAPTYDLCQVSVKGTNLFCVEKLRNAKYPEGVPRIEMPQLGGEPVPGSDADKLPRTPWNQAEVDGSLEFRDYIEERLGLKLTSGEYPAYKLKASQAELNGPNVAQMMSDKTFDPARNPIFVSNDDYVVDGHHRWAAVVGRDAADNKLGDITMRVHRIDAPITEVLRIAKEWSKAFGIKQKSVKSIFVVDIKSAVCDECP